MRTTYYVDMSSTVEQVKARLSVVDVVAQYVKLNRAGVNYKARCPFHNEKTPSFVVSPDRGTYHCFGCGVGGDIFSFVQEMEGVDFKGALKILAEKAGVEIVYEKKGEKDTTDRLFAANEEAARFFEKNLTAEHPARSYLTKRGLTEETITSFRLGWVSDEWRTLTAHLREKKFTDKEIEAAGLAKRTEKGLYDRFRSRIMFPLCDPAGRIVGFSARIFAEKGEVPADAPKYLNSPETPLYNKSRLLYGYERAKHNIRKLNFSILVEGQMDLISVHQAGWGNAVAVSGTALTREHLTLLMRFSENMVLALDADNAGIEAARRSATLALAMGMDVKVAQLPSGSDPADFILKEGKDAWKTRIREAKHVVEFLLAALAEQHKDARAYAKAVRKTVLPFIAMIQSPIDRDHFIGIVADTLGVSGDAVRSELTQMPKEARASEDVVATGRAEALPALTPRLRQAYGIVLWQSAQKKPLFEKEELLALLKKHAGSEALAFFKDIPEKQAEALRFAAESVFAHVPERSLKGEIEALFALIARDRLEHELARARGRLSIAESEGDVGEQKAAFELCTILTNEIAKLEKRG